MDKVFRNFRETVSGAVDCDYYTQGLDEEGTPIGVPYPYTLSPEELEGLGEIQITPIDEAKKAAYENEAARKALQRQRDEALKAMTHTFEDGRVVQVRPTDLPNFQTALALGTDQRWVMADNTTRMTTAAELQAALESGVAQAQQIWADYADALDSLLTLSE